MASSNASGLPGSAGGGSSKQAQSGGRDTSFGGGKGGTKLTKGVTAGNKRGQGVDGAGLTYNIRNAGGDKTLQSQVGKVGGTPPQTTGGLQKPVQSLRRIRPPVRGGSS
jgi:hypothetical protein